jgi:Helix-turn-helix domain
MKKNRIATRKARAEKNRTVNIETYKTRAQIKRENPVRDGDDELLTGQQTCAILDISSRTLYRLREKKEIGFITIGTNNYRYYRKRHVEAFMQRREMNARLIPHT